VEIDGSSTAHYLNPSFAESLTLVYTGNFFGILLQGRNFFSRPDVIIQFHKW
jgi:hypothetical protein